MRDFVKMLYERECGVVVMLCGCEEGGVEMCFQYWPMSARMMMKCGEFLVSTTTIQANNGFVRRVISITDHKVFFAIVSYNYSYKHTSKVWSSSQGDSVPVGEVAS